MKSVSRGSSAPRRVRDARTAARTPVASPIWLLPAIVALAGLVVIGYWAALSYRFLVLDDSYMVYENQQVLSGLNPASIAWAFRATIDFYMPLTWLSLMADTSIWGAAGPGYHLTNVALHIVNATVLLLFLYRATGSRWRSALVAALFAVHPLRVESVAWVSERKDVLSACFGFLALLSYVAYARRRTSGRFAAVAGLMALSLLAKATFVTLPALLLVLDFWPLRRMSTPAAPPHETGPGRADRDTRTLSRLLLEKWPLAALSAVCLVATMLAQSVSGAMTYGESTNWTTRVPNIALSYVIYLWKMVDVRHLAVFYPYRHVVPWAQVAGAVAVLTAITLLCLREWRQRPWLIVGWLWFVGTMVPMIGVVQIGFAAMADRYTYLPTVGVLIALVWSIPERLVIRTAGRWAVGSIAAATVFLLLLSTRAQVRHWRDSESLFTNSLQITGDNALALDNLGVTYARQRRLDKAIDCFERAIRAEPAADLPRYNLSVALADRGNLTEAMEAYSRGVEVAPENTEARHRAITFLRRALDSAPGARLDQMGSWRSDPALRVTREDLASAYSRAGVEAKARGDTAGALAASQMAVDLKPDSARLRVDLALSLAAADQLPAAREQLSMALRIEPGYAPALQLLRRWHR